MSSFVTAASGAESEVHGVGGLVVGNDDDGGDVGGAREEGNVQGAGGGSESRHTTTPTGKCQVPSCLFKGGGILQVRQQLADKGEDHAGFSLAVAEDSVCGTEVRVNCDFGGSEEAGPGPTGPVELSWNRV